MLLFGCVCLCLACFGHKSNTLITPARRPPGLCRQDGGLNEDSHAYGIISGASLVKPANRAFRAFCKLSLSADSGCLCAAATGGSARPLIFEESWGSVRYVNPEQDEQGEEHEPSHKIDQRTKKPLPSDWDFCFFERERRHRDRWYRGNQKPT